MQASRTRTKQAMQRHPDFDALRIVRGCSILNVAKQHLVNIEQIEILTLAKWRRASRKVQLNWSRTPLYPVKSVNRD
jgi:hypothetical protein